MGAGVGGTGAGGVQGQAGAGVRAQGRGGRCGGHKGGGVCRAGRGGCGGAGADGDAWGQRQGHAGHRGQGREHAGQVGGHGGRGGCGHGHGGTDAQGITGRWEGAGAEAGTRRASGAHRVEATAQRGHPLREGRWPPPDTSLESRSRPCLEAQAPVSVPSCDGPPGLQASHWRGVAMGHSHHLTLPDNSGSTSCKLGFIYSPQGTRRL